MMAPQAIKILAERVTIWTPRALCVLFAVFVATFALDAFDSGAGFWQNMSALLIHLIPAGLILVGLAVAWRWPLIGGVLFFGLGASYVAMAWGQLHWSTGLLIPGPLFLLASLFVASWAYRRSGRRLR